MAKKKKSKKETIIEKADEREEVQTFAFGSTMENAEEFVHESLEKVIEKFKNKVNDDNRFELVVEPVLTAIASVLADWYCQVGYSKGDLLERMCDFYIHSEIMQAEHANKCENCKKELEEKNKEHEEHHHVHEEYNKNPKLAN